MSRKSNKTLMFAALAAVAAAGAYFYYMKKVKDADFDDFDDFEDDDTELEDYLSESAYQSEQKERSIKDVFPINLSSEGVSEAKESLKKVVLDIGEKVSGVISDQPSGVVKSDSGAAVKDFSFYDLSADEDDFVKEDKPLDIIDSGRSSAQSEAPSYLDQVAASDEDSISEDESASDTDSSETETEDEDSEEVSGTDEDKDEA